MNSNRDPIVILTSERFFRISRFMSDSMSWYEGAEIISLMIELRVFKRAAFNKN